MDNKLKEEINTTLDSMFISYSCNIEPALIGKSEATDKLYLLIEDVAFQFSGWYTSQTDNDGVLYEEYELMDDKELFIYFLNNVYEPKAL